MKKEGVFLGVIAALSIFFANVVSAYGSFGYFGFGSFFGGISLASVLVLGCILIVLTALINAGLSRSILPNSKISGVVAIATSIIIMYFSYMNGISFSIDGLSRNLGLSSGILYTALGAILIIGLIYLGRKISFGGLLIFIGVVILLMTFLTNWIYEKGAAGTMAIILILLGWWLHRRYKRKHAGLPPPISKPKSKKGLLIIGGILITLIGGLFSNTLIALVGLGITALGILLWFFGLFKKKGPGNLPTSPQGTYSSKYNYKANKSKFNWLGKKQNAKTEAEAYKEKAYREAETEAHKEEAEREAYKEETQRRAYAARVMAKRTRDLQNAYNRSKAIYRNKTLPIPTRKAAAAEMQRLAQIAVSEGLRIRY